MSCVPLLFPLLLHSLSPCSSTPLPASIIPQQPFINCPPSSSWLPACLPVPRQEALLCPGLGRVAGLVLAWRRQVLCCGEGRVAAACRSEGARPAANIPTGPLSRRGAGDWDSRSRVASSTLHRPSRPSTPPSAWPPSVQACFPPRPRPCSSRVTVNAARENRRVGLVALPAAAAVVACPFPDGPRCCR